MPSLSSERSSFHAVQTAVHQLINEYSLDDPATVLTGCLSLLQTFLFPFVLGCMALATTYQCMKRLADNYIFPPPPLRTRYQNALRLYQQQQSKQHPQRRRPTTALNELHRLAFVEGYGKAIVSCAAHEIYMPGNSPAKGLRILQRDAKRDGIRFPSNTTFMEDDAMAILSGNAHMVQLNAKLARQEYLGIVDGAAVGGR